MNRLKGGGDTEGGREGGREGEGKHQQWLGQAVNRLEGGGDTEGGRENITRVTKC